MGIGAAYKDPKVVRKWATVAAERFARYYNSLIHLLTEISCSYAIETGEDSREVSKMKLAYENPEIITTWGTREEGVL